MGLFIIYIIITEDNKIYMLPMDHNKALVAVPDNNLREPVSMDNSLAGYIDRQGVIRIYSCDYIYHHRSKSQIFFYF